MFKASKRLLNIQTHLRPTTQPPSPSTPKMDSKILQLIEAAKEPRVGTHHLHWRPNEPYDQPYYTYSAADKRWCAVTPSSDPAPVVSNSTGATAASDQVSASRLSAFKVYSWNIDFLLPLGTERLTAALEHLRQLLTTATTTTQHSSGQSTTTTNDSPIATQAQKPSIILLQEMTNADLRVIQAQPWIRDGYHVTDTSNEYWESTVYGTCTLIPKSVRIRRVFRVRYAETVMERDAMFVDVEINNNNNGNSSGCLRICNTHLESLALEPPRRPAQMACAAAWMKGEGVRASVLGGDLNAIQPFDRDLHAENGLKDAYLDVGGEEDGEDCFTWGQMARTRERERFGLSRMDKLFFWGGVQATRFERFGLGVEVEGEANREELIRQGLDKPWVTDHLGIMGEFTILDG